MELQRLGNQTLHTHGLQCRSRHVARSDACLAAPDAQLWQASKPTNGTTAGAFVAVVRSWSQYRQTLDLIASFRSGSDVWHVCCTKRHCFQAHVNHQV